MRISLAAAAAASVEAGAILAQGLPVNMKQYWQYETMLQYIETYTILTIWQYWQYERQYQCQYWQFQVI